MITPLCELARRYGTDKGPDYHNYTPLYWNLMYCTQQTTKKLVDIGVMYGASTRMWLDFFPKATIYAIDKDPEAFTRLYATKHPGLNRVAPLIGDEVDEATWNPIPDELDYVIDDGSHFPENQMKNFELHFHRVKPGGLWIIEDTHCNFHPNFNPSMKDNLYPWLSQRIVEQQMGGGEAGNFYKAVNDLPDTDLRKMIYGIASYKSVIVFEKA